MKRLPTVNGGSKIGTKCLAIASTAAFALVLAHGSAFASHSKNEQGCVNAMNKDLSKMVKFEGKNFTKCVRYRTKAKVADAQVCFDSDPRGKVAKQADKTVNKDEVKKCAGKGVSPGGVIGYTSAATVNSAGEGAVEDLVSDIFGGSMSGKIDPTGGDKGKCQAAVTKRVQKIADTKMKEFIKCKKKEVLKLGSDDIASCVNNAGQPGSIAADTKGKIGKARTKLFDDITKKCDMAKSGPVDTDVAFPGNCVGYSGAALRDCLDAQVECRVCEAINAADGLGIDCYVFSGSGVYPTGCASQIGTHDCTLDAASQLVLHSALPSLLPVSGAIDIDCGSIDPGTGKAPCECSVQSPGFGPLSILGLFWACVKPAVSASCPAGEVDCDGGNSLGIDMEGMRNIGPCTSNADCASSCAAICAPYTVLAAECEGFCNGGTQMACLTDAQCGLAGEGSCNGPDGVGLGNICDCTCLGAAAGGASAPGDLQCQLAFNLTFEPIPGNGVACDGADVSVDLGDTCLPLTTQSAYGILGNGNNLGVEFPPGGFSDSGVDFDCASLASSVTTGAVFTGATMLYASTIGDINSQLTIVCQ